ncbi:ATP synthase subunit C [Haploplasma axanthum]|uniref:ATP synthase F(0) sector subunit c n=1 Tax=Haploplasma axanthum TaxID=29552 RepID=A0A449BDJ1_HAPAX|nr:ATP synthase subunit C [Haploplasma axanthum]VEU80487.1 V-type ATP synthase subunit K [Haploplasma axanthum]
MLNVLKIMVPILGVLLVILPLVKVFKGNASKVSVKKRMILHVALFFALVLGLALATPTVFAAEEVVPAAGESVGTGLKYIAAALATGLSALGAGIAVAAAAPSAIGAISENPKNFGKSLIFVALGEGVAIYGLLISILIIG